MSRSCCPGPAATPFQKGEAGPGVCVLLPASSLSRRWWEGGGRSRPGAGDAEAQEGRPQGAGVEEEAGPAGGGPREWTRPQVEHWAGRLGGVAGACRLKVVSRGMQGHLQPPGNGLETRPLGLASHTQAGHAALSHRCLTGGSPESAAELAAVSSLP